MSLDHALYGCRRSLNDHGEAQRLMHPLSAIVQGLSRQADAQITAIAFKDTYKATDNVVQQLVAAAETLWITPRSVVLPVDPVRHQHGRGHQRFQHAAVVVIGAGIVVQEGAAVQWQGTGTAARRDDEGRVAG